MGQNKLQTLVHILTK